MESCDRVLRHLKLMMTEQLALEIVRTWLETSFDGGRHARRMEMIDQD